LLSHLPETALRRRPINVVEEPHIIIGKFPNLCRGFSIFGVSNSSIRTPRMTHDVPAIAQPGPIIRELEIQKRFFFGLFDSYPVGSVIQKTK